MHVSKFAEYAKEKSSSESEDQVIISTNEEDVAEPLLAALALLENESKDHVVKFIYRGKEIGNVSKHTILNFIADSYGFETPGPESYTVKYKCPIGSETRTVTGGTSFVPRCTNHNVEMVKDEH